MARRRAFRRFTEGAARTAANQTYSAKATAAAATLRMRLTGGRRSIVSRGVTSPPMARRDIDRLQGEIEELFADLWQVPRFAGIRSGFRPAVDVWFTEDPPQLVVVVELAGVDPDSIELGVEERALTIAGSRARPRVPGQVYQQAEIEYGRFERRIPLEQNIDARAATAAYEAGMLRITLPVAARTPAGPAVVIVVSRSG